MILSRMAKGFIFLAAGLMLFCVVALVGYRVLTRMIHTCLLAVLGPEATVDGMEVGLRHVALNNLRITRKGVPAPLTVHRIVVTPSLRSLPTGQIRLSSVEVERPEAVIAIQPNGSMELPLALPAPAQGTPGGCRVAQVAISKVLVHDGRIELIDRTVRGPPVRLRLEQVQAKVQQLAVPLAPGKSPLEFEGILRGKKVDGRVRLSGWVDPTTQEASVEATLRSIDLTLLGPYLLTVQEAKVERGRLDMDLDFQVRQRKVNAPGKATIADLELKSPPGVVNAFLGLPRQGILNMLKTREGKIEIAFRVEGDLSDPRFQLQQSFATAMASGLAEQLGVSVKGVASGVITLGRKGAEGVGDVAKQLGGGVKRLLEGGR